MKDSYLPYVDIDNLRMVHHPFNTQINEMMNFKVSKFSPKSKTYSRSNSLPTRIRFAVGIQNAGYLSFIIQLFNSSGIPQLSKLQHQHFQMKDELRKKKSAKQQAKAFKLERKKKSMSYAMRG